MRVESGNAGDLAAARGRRRDRSDISAHAHNLVVCFLFECFGIGIIKTIIPIAVSVMKKLTRVLWIVSFSLSCLECCLELFRLKLYFLLGLAFLSFLGFLLS